MILVRVHEHEQTISYRIETFPCVLGRSIHCGICINDPSVSARHAELHETVGGFVLRDLASTNGIRVDARKITEMSLGAQDTVHLGDVRVDLISRDAPERTHANRLLPTGLGEGHGGTPAKILAAMTLAYAGLCLPPALEQYGIFWPPEHPSEIYVRAATHWVFAVVATLLISLFCKLNTKTFYFHNVLLWLTAAYVSARCFAVVSPSVLFNLHNLPFAGGVQHLVFGLLAFAFSIALQRYPFPGLDHRQRLFVGLGAAAAAVLITEITLARHRSGGERDAMPALGLALRPNTSVKKSADDLMFDIARSFSAADQQRIKTLEKIEDERAKD